MTIRKISILGLLLTTIVVGWKFGSPRVQQWLADREKSSLPPAEQLAEKITAPVVNAVETRYGININTSTDIVVPDEKNLAVPFTSQAPHANWNQDHQEFCEEASVLMVGRYFEKREITSADDAEKGLQAIKAWEVEHLGFYYDTTAAETAEVAEGLYNVTVTELVNPTIVQIKSALAAGKLVILPTAGRELGNPNFTAPGPIYHNLVIRGYTKDGKFITNDAGTRKGEAYVYKQQVVMDAIHDWVPNKDRTIPRNGDVANGRKVALIISAKD